MLDVGRSHNIGEIPLLRITLSVELTAKQLEQLLRVALLFAVWFLG
jgi:hypothetical protein